MKSKDTQPHYSSGRYNLYPHWDIPTSMTEGLKLKQEIAKFGEDMGQWEPQYTDVGSVNWYNHFRKWFVILNNVKDIVFFGTEILLKAYANWKYINRDERYA